MTDDKLPVSPYIEVEAMGSQIGLLACKLCGSTLILVSNDPNQLTQPFPNTPELHHAWHTTLSDERRDLNTRIWVLLAISLVLTAALVGLAVI